MNDHHVSDDELSRLLAGEALDDRVRAHLRGCVACEARLAAEARLDDALYAARRELFSREGEAQPVQESALLPTVRCENCGVGLARGASLCPACGRAIPGASAPTLHQEPRRAPWASPLIAAMAAAGVVALVLAGAALVGFDVLSFRHKGIVVVTVTGAVGGTVRFDDREPVRAEPSVTIVKVKPGAHTLVVDEPGMITYTTQIVTTTEAPLVAVKVPLRRNQGQLLVTSEPPGAMVIVDGAPMMRTPAHLDVEGGVPHAVRLELPGYVDVTADVTVPASETRTLRRDLQRVSP